MASWATERKISKEADRTAKYGERAEAGGMTSLRRAGREGRKRHIQAYLDPDLGKADEAAIRADKLAAGEAGYAAFSGAMSGSDNPLAALETGATMAKGAAAATAPLARSEASSRAVAEAATAKADFAADRAYADAKVDKWLRVGGDMTSGAAVQA